MNHQEARRYREAIGTISWNIDFTTFCDLIGEPERRNVGTTREMVNHFAVRKWTNWLEMCRNLAELGGHFDDIVGEKAKG